MSIDVMHARVAFRDRPFIDVMDLAVRFMMTNVWLYAKVALLVLAPCAAVTLLVAHVAGWLAGWLVALVLSFAAQVPFTVLASRVVFQEGVSARAVIRSSARELPRVLVTRLAWTLMMVLGTFILVGSVWLATLFLYVDEVVILERARTVMAFARTRRITDASLGQALVGVAMVTLAPLLAILLADIGGRAFIGEVLQFRAPPSLWADGGSVLAVLGFLGVLPYVATARFFAYLNARTRAEGWDIQTRFAAIAARAEQERAA